MTRSTRRDLLAGCGAALAAGLAGCTVSAQEVEETVREEYDAADVSTLRVTTTNGQVTVRGEDREIVSVRGTKRAPSEDRLDEVTLESSYEGDELTLSVEVGGEDGLLGDLLGADSGMDLELAVPASLSALGVESTNGDVDVADLAADVTATTTNGEVRTDGVRGSVDAETTNGDVDIGIADLRGDVTATTTNGDVVVRLPADADATVAMDTTNGDTTVRGFEDAAVSGSSAELGGGTHRIDLESTNGDLELVGR